MTIRVKPFRDAVPLPSMANPISYGIKRLREERVTWTKHIIQSIKPMAACAAITLHARETPRMAYDRVILVIRPFPPATDWGGIGVKFHPMRRANVVSYTEDES